MPGKKKCKILREIRQQIADENDIPFVTEECRYKGDCKGTCPKCESELRYLEQQLEKRRAVGKAVTVSALAVGMAASLAGCQPQVSGYLAETEPTTAELVVLEGEVADPNFKETDTDAERETETTEDGTFDPSDNVNVEVYGPPAPDDDWAGN